MASLYVSSLLVCVARNDSGASSLLRRVPDGFETINSKDGGSYLVLKRRASQRADVTATRCNDTATLILGDHHEWTADDSQPLGNATIVRCQLDSRAASALTGISGLPPLYIAETTTHVIVTSDLFLLRCVAAFQFRFDPEGVADLVRIGRPVSHRTLFRGVRLVPAGSCVTVSRSGTTVQSAWSPPEVSPCATWNEYTEIQADVFRETAAALDCSDTMLSLSGGLDSRTVFAALVASPRRVTAVTVTGEAQCLDARIASRLCRAYGWTHHIVTLGETFWRGLPDLAETASLLSGGISSISRAAQVYCYRHVGTGSPGTMLSGHLGNQVGRLGTEGLSSRNADVRLLSQQLVDTVSFSRPPEAWWMPAMRADGRLDLKFLIQQESMFGSLAPYSVGSSYSVQQTPYSSRLLIENLWRMPSTADDETGHAKLHVLRHRFLGVPLDRSFQRRYINQVGGFVAECPINWGWRSTGGVSIPGLFWGGLTCVDAVVATRVARRPAIEFMKALGIAGLHDWKPERQWAQRSLREFVRETLTSRTTSQSGVLDLEFVERRLARQDANPSAGFDDTLLAALDLALAVKNFAATA